jgi:methionyl-tRNA formyltransferase
VHPPERQAHGERLLAAASLPAACVFDGSRLDDPDVRRALLATQPEIGLSVLFGYLLAPDLIEAIPRGVLNLHPSCLPWHRGANANVWSIVEGGHAGVTLHRIDAGVDTGPIVAQEAVPIEPIDTGESLYRKLETAGLALLQRTWPAVREGQLTLQHQPTRAGCAHRRRDLEELDRLDLDRRYTARELIDRLRARTFPPYRGVWFEAGGRRVYLRIELEYGPEGESGT